jgi:hypothetical protein
LIKRIRFASADGFAAGVRAVGAAATEAPADARPCRIALCTSVPGIVPDPNHDGVAIEWFDDEGHLERFDAWVDSSGLSERLPEVRDLIASPTVIADEVVLRGAEWLDGRWRTGGPKLKHMAIAKRAAGLGPAEFSEKWKSRAGSVRRGDGPAVVIPDSARGLAYVQNHPRPPAAGDWAYDAVNEVYFDDEESLQGRVDWFAANLAGGTEDDLVSESSFLAVREEPV